jgi:hypothetical protein
MHMVDGRTGGEFDGDTEPPSSSDVVGRDFRPERSAERALGDFTTTVAILRLVPLAVLIGALSAGIALALLDMIGFLTNLLYFHRLSVRLVSPAANTLGALAVLVPVAGGLVRRPAAPDVPGAVQELPD